MGATTFVKSSTPKLATAQTHHPLKLHIDVPLLLIVIAMVTFGMVMLYSASWDSSVTRDMPPYSVVLKQGRMLLLGLFSRCGSQLV